jgi:hypothetical protein
MGRTGGVVAAHRPPQQADSPRRNVIEGLNYLEQGNSPRIPAQSEPPALSASRFEHAGTRQLVQRLREIVTGDAQPFGQLGGAELPAGFDGEGQDGPEGVFRGLGEHEGQDLNKF